MTISEKGEVMTEPVVEIAKPKAFSVQDIVGGDEALKSLVKRITNKIEKEKDKGLPRPKSTQRLWDLKFPPKKEIPTEADMTILGMNGETAWTALVTYNDLNRPVDLDKTVQYAIDMLTGKWHSSSHQGIAFTWEPTLQDGQHRCLALYLASLIDPTIVITFHLFFNRAPEARDKIDTGRNRTSADKLVMNLKIHKGVSFDNNKYGTLPAKTIYSVVSNMPSCKYLSEDAKLSFAEKNIQLVADVLQVLSGIRGIRLHAAWAGVFVDAALFFGKDTILPLAKRFAINNWDHQGHESRVDPFFTLHSRLSEDKSRTSKLTAPTICAMTVFAIRKALLGELVTYTKNSKGTRHEARFPKFSQSEAEDYKKNKEKSKLLKKNSISVEQKRSSKASKEDDLEDGVLDNESGEMLALAE